MRTYRKKQHMIFINSFLLMHVPVTTKLRTSPLYLSHIACRTISIDAPCCVVSKNRQTSRESLLDFTSSQLALGIWTEEQDRRRKEAKQVEGKMYAIAGAGLRTHTFFFF